MSELRKLDLGCGETPKEGYEGVDLYTKQAKHKFDLLKFPWKLKDNSVEEIYCSHFFEHVPGKLRGQFMEEVFRILIPGGKATFITPYWSSPRAVQDPTHEWPPICEETYNYFDKVWREANHLNHPPYPTECDFEMGRGYGYHPRLMVRSQEFRDQATLTQLNSVNDLAVTLVSRKRAKIK